MSSGFLNFVKEMYQDTNLVEKAGITFTLSGVICHIGRRAVQITALGLHYFTDNRSFYDFVRITSSENFGLYELGFVLTGASVLGSYMLYKKLRKS